MQRCPLTGSPKKNRQTSLGPLQMGSNQRPGWFRSVYSSWKRSKRTRVVRCRNGECSTSVSASFCAMVPQLHASPRRQHPRSLNGDNTGSYILLQITRRSPNFLGTVTGIWANYHLGQLQTPGTRSLRVQGVMDGLLSGCPITAISLGILVLCS